MRRSNFYAPTQRYGCRHVYVDLVLRIRRLAARKNLTQEEVLNEALDIGLTYLEEEWRYAEEDTRRVSI